jgi:anti-sigma factor RsiW
MNCENIKNILNDYYDEKLSDDQKAELENHIEGCKECNHEFKKYKNLFETIKLLPMNMNVPKKLVYDIYDELGEQK